jgi:hypothetical protein
MNIINVEMVFQIGGGKHGLVNGCPSCSFILSVGSFFFLCLFPMVRPEVVIRICTSRSCIVFLVCFMCYIHCVIVHWSDTPDCKRS